MYTKTNWVARVGTALNRFLKTNETSTEVELTADPTGVTTAGTPFTVANMNKIEQGIYDNSVAIEDNINQGVKTTDSPTFASVNTGHGANEVFKISKETLAFGNVQHTVVTRQVAAMAIDEIRFVNLTGTFKSSDSAVPTAKTLAPAVGTYIVPPNFFSGGAEILSKNSMNNYDTPITGGFIIRRLS